MKNILAGIFALALLAVALPACEKEKDFFADAKAGASNGAGFGLSNIDGISLSVDASVTNLDTAIKVFLSTTFGSATNVAITVDTSVVNEYNSANGTAYDYLDADSYTVPASIAIPAGQKEGDGILSVNIQQLLTHGTAFALGISITGVSGGTSTILTDNSRLFILIQVKNPYEADYTVKGFLFHPSAPRAIATTKHLATVGAVTSYADLGDLGGSGYHFLFDVDGSNHLTNWVAQGVAPASPKSGFMTMDNGGGVDFSAAAPDNAGTPPWVVSTYNNTYDPSTSTFWMHYGYYSAAVPLPGTGEVTYSRIVYEKWVRQ